MKWPGSGSFFSSEDPGSSIRIRIKIKWILSTDSREIQTYRLLLKGEYKHMGFFSRDFTTEKYKLYFYNAPSAMIIY